jgi:glycosyltransferase involved in cell wall biosynthesis
MSAPDVALVISSFQRPGHVLRALQSIALQQGVAGRFEVVVTDDGSTDETAEVVGQFAAGADFPVRFTTHPHNGFRVSISRNEGVAASRAPYLLFSDGDCILPSNHVRIHLDRRRPGVVRVGDCCRLDEATSRRVTDAVIRSGEFRHWGPAAEVRRLRRLRWKSQLYQFLRHPAKPKLIGNNVGMWRADYERVNGSDENFEGWGCEDDDLGHRLRRAGVQFRSILPWTNSYHLWHPVHPTQPKTWREGLNVRYMLRSGRLTRCRNGLVKRTTTDLSIRLVDEGAESPSVQRLIRQHLPRAGNAANPEVEILVVPGRGRFSGRADCNILVALEDGPQVARLAARADILVGDGTYPQVEPERQFRLEQLPQALKAVA